VRETAEWVGIIFAVIKATEFAMMNFGKAISLLPLFFAIFGSVKISWTAAIF